MGKVNLLPSSHDLHNFAGVGKDVLDLLRKLLGVARLEEKERLFAEIVLYAWSAGSNHGFPESKIFKNASRSVNLRKRISMIRNDAHITVFDFQYNIFQSLRPKVTNRLMQAF